MLHWLFNVTGADHFALRGLAALVTAFLVAVLAGAPLIAWLKRKGIGERTGKTPIEDEKLLELIEAKVNTPTMGGIIIAAGLIAACLLWADLTNLYLWLALACFVALGALGMVDDWQKLTSEGHRDRGLKVRHKLVIQGLVGAGLGALYWLRMREAGPGAAPAPPLQDWLALLGPLAIVWTALVVTTMSNAVNVTDGLDGLAGGLALVALVPLGYVAGGGGEGFRAASCHPATAELAVFCAALGGGLLGFLRHNWHPARVFMGDTGSLALGGSLGLVAVMARADLLLPLIAFVFLAEFGSSVLQVLWFKATGRRILPIAPAHHIFQKMGWPETHVVARFLIVGAMAAGTVLIFV